MSTRLRTDYASDFDAFERQRANQQRNSPRALALLNAILDALDETNDENKRQSIQCLSYSVSTVISTGKDLTADGEASFRARLAKLIGRAS